MEKYLMIGAGAVAGALCRYWMGLWVAAKWGTGFVYGTLAINFIGSFVLGFFLVMNLDRGLFSPNLRFFIAVGWCASFTTYSTFSWETFRYIQEGNWKLAGANMALTLGGCLAATWAGATLGKII